MRKPAFAICEQQRHRSACASAQSDQHLCCSLPRQYNNSCFYTQNFKPLSSFCGCAGQFESILVTNPEGRFSRDEAQSHNWGQFTCSHCSWADLDFLKCTYEPPHENTNKVTVRPRKTQISLSTHPVWSESSLCTQYVANDPSFLHANNEDSDQTGRMPRLIWVFAGRADTLLVLSWGGSI